MSYPPPTESPYQRPFAQGPSDDEKTQAMLSWILSFFFAFIPPLIFFLMADGKPYLKRQAALALTTCIVMFVGYMIGTVLMVVLIGLLILPVVFIWNLVLVIQGAIASHRGEEFEPALIGGWCRSIFKL
jgi:uncharacterized membrane protein